MELGELMFCSELRGVVVLFVLTKGGWMELAILESTEELATEVAVKEFALLVLAKVGWKEL